MRTKTRAALGRSLGTHDPTRDGACVTERSWAVRVSERHPTAAHCPKPDSKLDHLCNTNSIGYWNGNGGVIPSVLPTVGRGPPTKYPGLGPLWPTVGNTFVTNTPFSVYYPRNVDAPGNSRVQSAKFVSMQTRSIQKGIRPCWNQTHRCPEFISPEIAQYLKST